MQGNPSPSTPPVNLNRRHAIHFLREAYTRLQLLTETEDGIGTEHVWVRDVMDAYSAALMASWLYDLLGDQEAAMKAWNLCDPIASILTDQHDRVEVEVVLTD